MYIILAAALVAIAAYYPIKLIKFYCMESKGQGLKAEITQDLREGKVSRNLILLTIGEGGLRLMHSQLDNIFGWMVQNTDAWRVHTYPDEKTVVLFSHTPFHPEEWEDYEDYKCVMRQMFGEFGTKDFLTSRTTVEESDRVFRDFIGIGRQIKLYDYITFDINGVRTLGMVMGGGGILNGIYTVKILSGGSRGQYCTVGEGNNVSRIEPDEAVKELSRQKGERENKKREEAVEKRREEFHEKYGNIRSGTYLRGWRALYIVDSVDMEKGTATCIRLVDLGIGFRANEKCVLPLENGFRIATPDEAAEILLKEYGNE